MGDATWREDSFNYEPVGHANVDHPHARTSPRCSAGFHDQECRLDVLKARCLRASSRMVAKNASSSCAPPFPGERHEPWSPPTREGAERAHAPRVGADR